VSTDPRKLFATEQIENPARADPTGDGYQTGRTASNRADPNRFSAQRERSQNLQRAICVGRSDKNNETSFICHIKWIQPKDLACSLYFFAYRNSRLINPYL
jgi:hypothetical protein